MRSIYKKYGTLIIFLLIFVAASFASPSFLKVQNLLNVLLQLSVVTLLALGATFVITLGQIDVSVGSVAALTGCLACAVMSSTKNIFLAVLTGLLVGCAVGFINGFIISQFKIPAFVMTLGMTTAARGTVLLYTNAVPITDLGSFIFIGQGSMLGLPMPIIILAVAFLVCSLLMRKTKFGRYVVACGGNVAAAEASGINVKLVTIQTFLLNGILTAIAGLVLMARINSGQPSQGVGYEFDAITAVVVGGTTLAGGVGTVSGTLIGSLIVGVINNVQSLLGISYYWQQIIKGIIIVLAVILDVQTKHSKLKKKL